MSDSSVTSYNHSCSLIYMFYSHLPCFTQCVLLEICLESVNLVLVVHIYCFCSKLFYLVKTKIALLYMCCSCLNKPVLKARLTRQRNVSEHAQFLLFFFAEK